MANLKDLFLRTYQLSKKAFPIMGDVYKNVPGAISRARQVIPETLDLSDDIVKATRFVPTAGQLSGVTDDISRLMNTGNTWAGRPGWDLFLK